MLLLLLKKKHTTPSGTLRIFKSAHDRQFKSKVKWSPLATAKQLQDKKLNIKLNDSSNDYYAMQQH